MNINGISINYPMGYETGRTQRTSTEKNFAKNSYTYCGTFRLRMGGLSSMGLMSGANITVYKSDSYTEDNPILRIATISETGEENEYFLDPRKIDVTNASQCEIFALRTWLVDQGKMDSNVYARDLFGADISPTDLSQALTVKKNYYDIAKEMMEMQYNAHNYSGYALYRGLLGAYDLFMKMQQQHDTGNLADYVKYKQFQNFLDQ